MRRRQAHAGRTEDQDDFGILLSFGADCIGAVGIVPADHGPPLSDKEPHSLEEAAKVPGRTISGVQQKLLAYRDEQGFHPSGPEDAATHIAKFNSEALPTLVQNEHLSLQLARQVLGPDEVTNAAPATLQDIDGVALLVERFDRKDGERLRLEDFAQILGKPRGRRFDGKYQSSYEEAATAIANHSARPKIDLDRYYRLVLFNLVISNADAHLKNFSLLERPEGLRLSPAYDLLNSIIYRDYEADSALAIGGRKHPLEAIGRGLIEQLGLDIGLPRQAVARSIETLARKFAAAPALQLQAHVQPDDFRARYRDIVVGNAERILA